MGTVRVVDLDAPGLTWVEVTMPASSGPVRLVRLHADRATGASVSLVRFPAGWARPGTGHYTCAEEFVALDGRISVSGAGFPAGAHKYLPALATRSDSSAGPDGCLAVAWFSGPPVWRDGAASHSAPDRPVASGPVLPDSVLPGSVLPGSVPPGSVPPDSVLLGSVAELPDRLPGGPADGDAGEEFAAEGFDAVFVEARTWAYVPAGEPFPDLPGPVLVRRWPRSGA
ncbi:hypothetical protein [Microtetraspora niveoalba]|uniref:hypothetical protein n=1 Tax=Microtetraspora niveoalba TaxID=46175 RepID=UPI00082D1A64|nr:hypothetical protein [Microtetraspora niveoalba]